MNAPVQQMPQLQQPAPVFLSIMLTAESVQLAINALRKLPHEVVADLVQDMAVQANNQLQAKAQEAQAAEAKAKADAEAAEKAAKKAAKAQVPPAAKKAVAKAAEAAAAPSNDEDPLG